MPDETGSAPQLSESADLRKQIETLSAENLLLRQQVEFQRLFTEYREKQAEMFGQHKKDVDGEINKRLVGMTVLGIAVAAIAWWSTITPVRKLVTDRLDKEFASDNIRGLISSAAQQAAESQTKQLIEGELKPATDEALREIKQQREDVTNFAQQVRRDTSAQITQVRQDLQGQGDQEKKAMENLRGDYTKSLGELKALVVYQEQLKGIELLKGASISGDAASFYKLDSYTSADASLIDAAHSAGLETKVMYLSGTRVKSVSIFILNSNGSHGATDEKIPTASLLTEFLLNPRPQWEIRDKAAVLLGTRREAEVLPALVTCMSAYANLWVRRDALRSFEQLTGFQENDVFDFQGAANWWEKNKDTYLNSLPKK
jgi:hypothetical protein